MIHILPGMGADRRMYPGPWRSLRDAAFVEWPRGAGHDTISSLADWIIASAGIGDRDVVVGSSLGGMVACEIATKRKLKRLILVGSAKRPGEINSLLRLLHPLADLAPFQFVQQACGKVPSELGSMFAEADPAFVRSMCRAVFRWDGLQEGIVDIRRIHGRHDLVIPPPSEGATIIGGGHLIAMSHADECIRFVHESIDE